MCSYYSFLIFRCIPLLSDDQVQSIEERELTEKLAKLNAQVAQANAELADALRLSAETESTAVEAQLAAEKAKEEARNIQEEIAFRAKVRKKCSVQLQGVREILFFTSFHEQTTSDSDVYLHVFHSVLDGCQKRENRWT